MSYDYAVHSDFLIHWTGRDIDSEHDPKWYEDHHRSDTKGIVTDLYLDRLRDILTYGLWMMQDGQCRFRRTPQCCFTELKLSESRRHAKSYGRLGIGVKRPFLFNRSGRPLVYYGFGDESHQDRFYEACLRDLQDKSLMNFFKAMNSNPREKLTYELYAESEWRILYFDELLEMKKIIDPRDSSNTKEHEYFNSLRPEQQDVLKCLIPLDDWFAMIIYPSLPVKNHAQSDSRYGIIEQIRRIKRNTDHGYSVERGSWPIEVDLDACRNF
jgi:hypothetical protein